MVASQRLIAVWATLLLSAAAPATEWPGDEWPTSTPADQGVDPSVIDGIVADMRAGNFGKLDYFLLIRNGYVIADHAFEQEYGPPDADEPLSHLHNSHRPDYQYNYDDPGWHPYYRGSELHSLQSVTKSVTSAAFGIAVDKGLIRGVDVPAMTYFGGYDHDMSDPRKQAMTIRDLLTMQSGIDWNTEGGYDNETHSTVLLEDADEWIQFILDRPMEAVPGTEYEYNDGASVLLGKIIREATGQRADQWTSEQLFAPIGINDHYWKITPDGEADTEGGLYLSAHDIARIGYLFLHNGEWDGEQLISSTWVSESVAPLVVLSEAADDGYGTAYGYQWWIPIDENGRARSFMGNGYGGQFLVVVPDYDLVAVFNGWNIHPNDYPVSWHVVEERIIPAITGTGH